MNRREFTAGSLSAACIGGFFSASFAGTAHSQESLARLNRSHPPAQALKYVEDASRADPSVYPADASPSCASCRHYQGSNDPRGGCALYPGFSVRASGWCTGWVASKQSIEDAAGNGTDRLHSG